MTPDEIIEVLQGFKAGREWQFLSRSGEWKVPTLSSLESMLHALYSQQTIRLAPLPDEITIPARVIPAPLREAPDDGTLVYCADPVAVEGFVDLYFYGDEKGAHRWLAEGLLFDTAEKASKAGKAMRPYA